MGVDRGGVLARHPDPLPEPEATRFEALVARRQRREPFQYLAGEQEFMGSTFHVDSRVLIPRPETEDLVDAVLAAALPLGARVADLGTGSGCIAVALALRRPDLRLLALDASPDAVDVARANAERLGAGGRLEFCVGDLTAPPRAWRSGVDAVVSNPPYVAEAEWTGLAPEVRDHEPRAALVPGPTGLEAYRVLAPAAAAFLAPGGLLAVELGHRSLEGARGAIEAAGFSDIGVRDDPRGIPRVLTARRRRP
jgi:release factor glutamine methyltransferase